MKKLIILGLITWSLKAGDFYVRENEKIKEDISLIGESLVVKGIIEGDVAIVNGDLNLYGRIEGDVAIVGGNANLYEGSRIGGNIAVVGGKINKEEGAEIEGEISQISLGPFNALFKLIPHRGKISKEIEEEKLKGKREFKIKKKGIFVKPILIFIWGLSLSVILLLICLIAPGGIENMEFFIEKKMGYSLLAGFLTEILFVPAIIILAISILGIPLIPLFVIAFILALLLSLAPSSLFVGKLLKRNLTFLPDKIYLISPLGLFLLFVFWLFGSLLQIGNTIIGIFGSVISIVAIFILYLYFTSGLGSIILSKLGTRKP